MTKFTPMAANEDDGASRRRIHLREISGDGDAPLETVGQDLRAARIRRGDDLAAVSRALKIRKDHLDALEGDRLDDLPGKTYAIGFVRSYARYLGLDANELTERFKAEISGRHDDQIPDSASLHEEEARRLPYGGRVLAGVVILALLYGVWHIFFNSGDTTPPVPPPPALARITETPPAASAPAPAETAPAAPEAAATPDASAPATPAPQASNPVAATPQAAPSNQPEAAVPALPPNAPQSLGQQTRDTRVILRARANTRITITSRDGRTLLNRDLAPGEIYYVPNQSGLIMALSNAGAIDVDLDGAQMGRVGSVGQVVGRVSLDPQSLVDRYNSR
jgi:cytoskeleton protein RodZ